MRKWILLGLLPTLPGCASTDSDGKPQVPSPVREALSGAKWGAWTPELPPE